MPSDSPSDRAYRPKFSPPSRSAKTPAAPRSTRRRPFQAFSRCRRITKHPLTLGYEVFYLIPHRRPHFPAPHALNGKRETATLSPVLNIEFCNRRVGFVNYMENVEFPSFQARRKWKTEVLSAHRQPQTTVFRCNLATISGDLP